MTIAEAAGATGSSAWRMMDATSRSLNAGTGGHAGWVEFRRVAARERPQGGTTDASDPEAAGRSHPPETLEQRGGPAGAGIEDMAARTCWACRPGGATRRPLVSERGFRRRRCPRWRRGWTSWRRGSGPGHSNWRPVVHLDQGADQEAREAGDAGQGSCRRAEGTRGVPGDPRHGVTSSEDNAGWLAFLRGLVARGLSGVQLVISDDHAGLVTAIAAVLPGAAWQRCRTHYHGNLVTRVPKSAQPWASTLVRTIFEQPAPPRSRPGTTRPSPRSRPSCRRPRPIWTGPRRHPGVTPSPEAGGRSGWTTGRSG